MTRLKASLCCLLAALFAGAAEPLVRMLALEYGSPAANASAVLRDAIKRYGGDHAPLLAGCKVILGHHDGLLAWLSHK